MNGNDIIEEIIDLNSNMGTNCLFLDGYEDAIVGYEYSNPKCKEVNEEKIDLPIRAVYDFDKCIKVLMDRDGMNREVAEEYFDFNTLGAIDPYDERYPILIKTFN